VVQDSADAYTILSAVPVPD